MDERKKIVKSVSPVQIYGSMPVVLCIHDYADVHVGFWTSLVRRKSRNINRRPYIHIVYETIIMYTCLRYIRTFMDLTANIYNLCIYMNMHYAQTIVQAIDIFNGFIIG